MLLKYLFLFCLLTGILLFSCQKDNPQGKLLTQSQDKLVNNKPEIALNLLASIPNPEKMDKESYMQYIVIFVGAKYETKADITKDTLIFEAQRYFNKNEDLKYTVLANYYTAQLYDESGNFPKALESYMLAVNAADKSNNDFLAGKSLNNIGYIYYGQLLFDSAIVNYKKALQHYNKIENVDKRKLKTFTNIGLAYESDNGLDSAYVYFQKGLDLAKQTGNRLEESQLYQNLGLVSLGKGEDEKAIEYFKSVLAMDITANEQIRQINLQLLKIYNKKQDLQSAQKYAVLVTANLSEVTYKYTIKRMYAALTDYYRQSGDYKKALEYSDLEKVTNDEIETEKEVSALLEADKNYYLGQKDEEVQLFKSETYIIFIVLGAVLGIVLLFVFLGWRTHKKDQAEIQFCVDKYNELRRTFVLMNDRYPKIEAEIKSILEDE